MDYPDFAVVQLRREEAAIRPPFFMRAVPGRWREQARCRWLMWKFPVAREEFFLLSAWGEVIVLPFCSQDLAAFRREEITDMLHRIILREGVQNIVVEKELESYLEKGMRIDGRMLPLLMSGEIIRHVCRRHQIARRELALVVIASDYLETKYVLDKIGHDINGLAIVAQQPEEYEVYARYAYEEEGLLVQVLPRPLRRELYGNVVVELAGEPADDFQYYRPGSVVLNFSGNFYRTRDALSKRRDLVCYNRFDIRAEGQVRDNRVLQAAIYKTSSRLGQGQLPRGEKLKELYGLEVEKTGIET